MFSKLGRFEIKDILGRGAMGEVYLGVDPILGREVAIKTIISSALPEDQARQRFDREAKAAAVLNSPNIVTIHELGEDQGVLFIAMERLKGQDLEQILMERSLTLVESLEVLAQVCDGLDAAHRNHIIHRDIKPSNIMVMREGRKLLVKLMDFGVARLKDSAMTMVGTVIGTVNYIAPEYIRSGEPDARSDLFAVGVMLYECISGKKPFEGGSASTVLFKIVNDPPAPLDLSMLHGLNPALRNMTEKALAKDPDDRFQSAEEFALALRAAKDPAWNGKVEETTVRMKIRPMLASEPLPVIEPLAVQTVATAVSTAPSSSLETITAPEPAKSSAVAAKAITQEVVVTTAPPTAKTEILNQPEPVKPMPEVPVISKLVSEPCAAETIVLKIPQAPEPALSIKPSTPVLPTSEVAVSKAGTQEIVVTPQPVPSGEFDAAKTVTLKLPLAPKPALSIKPSTPTLSTSEVAVSKAGTQEIVVTPQPVSEYQAAKTEVLALAKAPETVKPPEAPPVGAPVAKIAIPEVPAELKPAPAGESSQTQAKIAGTSKQEPAVPILAARTEVLAVTHDSPPFPETKAEKVTPQPLEAAQPADGQMAAREVSPPSLTDESTRKTPDIAGVPPRSSRGLIVLVFGLIALAILGGAGYFFFKSRAIPPPSVAPVSPTPSISPDTTPPQSIPAPQTQAPKPIPPSKPSAGRVKPKGKTSVKTPPPAVKTSEPPPVSEVVAPPPPAQPVTPPPPPPPVQDEKAKKKMLTDAATRKRMEQEDRLRK